MKTTYYSLFVSYTPGISLHVKMCVSMALVKVDSVFL